MNPEGHGLNLCPSHETVAQLAEQQAFNLTVVGSIPTGLTLILSYKPCNVGDHHASTNASV